MAAKVYAPPEGVEVPGWDEFMRDGKFSIEVMTERESRYLAELAAWLKTHGYAGELAGEVVRWGHADGCAQYMVMRLRPLMLIHLPLGDAYRKDAIFERGLTAADIREQVSRKRRT
jgi:hypothetical protein